MSAGYSDGNTCSFTIDSTKTLCSSGNDARGFNLRVLDADFLALNAVDRTGSTALQYSWSRRNPPCKLGTSAAAAAKDVFFIRNPCGQIMPGGALDIPFCFCSTRPGVFTEPWVVNLNPKPSNPPAPLLLRGVCIEEVHLSEQKRALEKQLAAREIAQEMAYILTATVLPAVYDAVAPKEEAPRVDPQTAAPSGAGAAERWASFLGGYAAAEGLAEPVATDAFADLDALWCELPEGAPCWQGCPATLEGVIFEVAPEAQRASLLGRRSP